MLDTIERLVRDTRHMADNIAHDLQTPLTRLQSKLERVTGAESESEAVLEDIQSEIERLQSFCRSLLHLASVESENIKSQFKTVSLNQLVGNVTEMYQPIMEDLAFSFSVSLQDVPCNILGDANLIQQALSNCLDNCVKYVPGGQAVSVTLSEESSFYVITIQDSGPGLNEEQIDNVQQKFYRAERDRSSPGHGLGLALVNSILNAHEGKVNIQNSAGLRVELSFPKLNS